jgi:hypothetical protein
VAAREQSGTDISQGVIQRVVTGLRYAISGVGPTNWFGPQQPMAPQAQEQTEGRALDYPVGYNLRITPREGEAVSFGQLRALADAYDLLRLVIETRKDQIASFEWEIVPIDRKATPDEAAIKRVSDFFAYPDREHSWDQWLRMQVEDLLVIDAVAVYPRGTRGGDLYGFELVDGATLKRLIDDGGRTPVPPNPAYQQILKGIPASDYTSDQLIYTMRNPRTNRFYGYSPVEQVITTVNIALRRQMTQLAFYTEGNVPEALAQMPPTWTAKQISDFQIYWDSIMEGNAAAKRKMRFIPSLDKIVFPKDAVLKDEMDEWLARIVCFAFSITPSALIKQVNRASGEQMSDTAKEEGLIPLLRFLATHMTRLVQRHLNEPGLKFQFKIVNKVDPIGQATIHGVYVDKQVLTPDEVREDLGKEKMTPEEREAAFPTPVPMGVDEEGNPIEAPTTGPGAFGKKPGAAPGAKKPPAANDEEPEAKQTAAEKMLADAIRMLDPTRLAAALEKAAASQAPRIVEVRPEVNLEVGDTVVHVPAPTVTAPLAKREDPQEGKRLVAKRMGDGSMVATWEPKDTTP